LEMCDALILVPDPRRILDSEAPEAFALAETVRDGPRACRASFLAFQAVITEKAGPGFSTPQAAEWAEKMNRYAKPNSIERAFADIALGATLFSTGRSLQEGLTLISRVYESNHLFSNPNIQWWSGALLLLYQNAPQLAKDTAQLAEEIMGSSRVGVQNGVLPLVYEMAGNAFLALGQRQRAEKAWSELLPLYKRTGLFYAWMLSTAMDGVLSVIDGRLEDAQKICGQIRARGEELKIAESAEIHAGITDTRIRLYLHSNLETLEQVYRRFDYHGTLHALVLAHLGRKEEVSEILSVLVINRFGIGTPQDLVNTIWDAKLLEAAVLTNNHQAAELLLHRFAGTGVVTPGIFQPTCIPRHLGAACALLGRYDEARKYYQEAIKVCTEMRFRPEMALTRLQLAELLLEHYPIEKKDAIEHLDFCIKEFQEMKMQPSLERALRHKEILKA
jgi:tetratricopeptide (TPR) repeat protein